MGAGWAGSVGSGSASAKLAGAPRQNTLMHVGGDYHSVAGSGITSAENLQYNLRYGVKHLTAQISKTSPEGAWDLDQLKRMKDDCDRYGVELEAIRMSPDYITLPKGPGRDRTLDAILANLQKASAVGVKFITYHWTVIPIRRNTHTPGRGGSEHKAIDANVSMITLIQSNCNTVNGALTLKNRIPRNVIARALTLIVNWNWMKR